VRLLIESVETDLSRKHENMTVAKSTQAWLLTLRERIVEIEENTEEAFKKRRDLVKLLVEKITVDRSEDRQTEVQIIYRFGPPPEESASFVDVHRASEWAVGHNSAHDVAYQFLRFCEVLPGGGYYQLVEPKFLYPEGELRQPGCHPGRSVQAHDVAERLLEPPGFPAKVLECLEQIGELGGIELVSLEGEPAVSPQGGAPKRRSAHPADEDGRAARLRRARLEDQALRHSELVTLEGFGPSRPAPPQDLDHLVGASPTSFKPVAERLDLLGEPSGADSKYEAASTQSIQCCGRLR
jgi:hypothetical protein